MECRWLETFPLLVIASFCRKIEHKFDRLEVFGGSPLVSIGDAAVFDVTASLASAVCDWLLIRPWVGALRHALNGAEPRHWSLAYDRRIGTDKEVSAPWLNFGSP
jgi:hypothetical protein